MESATFTFKDSVTNVRGGFKHVSTLLKNNVPFANGVAHWGNRTWEFKPFWTSRKEAIRNGLTMRNGNLTASENEELHKLLDQYVKEC